MRFFIIILLLLGACSSGQEKGSIYREEILGKEVTVGSYGDLGVSPEIRAGRNGRVARVNVSASLLNPTKYREEMENIAHKVKLRLKSAQNAATESTSKEDLTKKLLDNVVEHSVLRVKEKLCFKINLFSRESKDSVEPAFWQYALYIDKIKVPVKAIVLKNPQHEKGIESSTTGGYAYNIGNTTFINPSVTTVYDVDKYSSATDICSETNVDKNTVEDIELILYPLYDLQFKGQSLTLSWRVK